MNAGSTRKTVRFGDDMIALIEDELAKRNANPTLEPWTFSDYVMQAVAEKLSHARRGRKQDEQVRQQKIDQFRPREVTDE